MTIVSIAAALLLSSGALEAGQAPAKPVPDWPQPIVRGSLIIYGGESVLDVARKRFIQLAGGEKARIVVLAVAGREIVRDEWAEEDVASFAILSTGSRAEAGDPAFAAPIREATGVWLEGSGLTGVYLGTGVERVLKSLKERGGVIAGPSDLGRLFIPDPDKEPVSGFNLLPDSLVAVTSASNDGDDGLTSVLEKHPGLVGFGVPETAALVLRGRTVTVIGSGNVSLRFAPGGGREAAVKTVRPGTRADLIAIRRMAIDRTLPPFPPKAPKAPEVTNGSLVIIGGGGLPAGLLQRFIDLAGGADAPLVYVPCSFAEEIEDEPGFVRALRRAGAKNVTWIHTKDRNAANSDEKILGPLRKAKGIWFGGGRQWNLVDSYQDTKAHELMWDVLKRGGVIGGSSAGASIQCEYLARGDPLGNRNIIAEGYERGLGFLPGAAVDQHFSQRGRRPDMTLLVNTYPQLLGIGIDEGTAIVVQGSVAEVVGRNSVHFYDRRKPVPEEGPDYEALQHGMKYDLKLRKAIDPDVAD
ncbi:MAG: Type 1 glutamine amidotransferase-like domain-containing protein [Armatimonadetes bacterium]|nr:Type 1 glutamine amidotransferase-like domain-containing protein [Armatimonadota bacterium]